MCSNLHKFSINLKKETKRRRKKVKGERAVIIIKSQVKLGESMQLM